MKLDELGWQNLERQTWFCLEVKRAKQYSHLLQAEKRELSIARVSHKRAALSSSSALPLRTFELVNL